ncbi:hypothetical protein [Vibrio scophthalmi]|uniref:DUF2059 domain-containing protein n=1 Tax=Vibrio scophthalmi TaxID=45658 RepID=A0A1C7FHY1_9VIBR|nr:hypothetical protein [Vibrio scophthalmi]ANU38619.1 hypothetical protein VSVS05_03582 [Vibrio scophthalmi]
MKRIKITSIVATLSLVSTAYAEVMSPEQLGGLFQDSSISPQTLLVRFSQYSVEDNIAMFLQEVATKRRDIFEDVLVSSFIQYPDYVDLIVNSAREAKLTNEEITIAAIEAGIDPTIIAEATAAGTEAIATIPVPNAPTKKDPISSN